MLDSPKEKDLQLYGKLDGNSLNMTFNYKNRAAYPLVKRGFHWIQEYPYNR